MKLQIRTTTERKLKYDSGPHSEMSSMNEYWCWCAVCFDCVVAKKKSEKERINEQRDETPLFLFLYFICVFVEQCDEMELYCAQDKWFDMQKTISRLNYFRAHSSWTNQERRTKKNQTQATNQLSHFIGVERFCTRISRWKVQKKWPDFFLVLLLLLIQSRFSCIFYCLRLTFGP